MLECYWVNYFALKGLRNISLFEDNALPFDSRCPGSRGRGDEGAPPCEGCAHRGWWRHSSLHIKIWVSQPLWGQILLELNWLTESLHLLRWPRPAAPDTSGPDCTRSPWWTPPPEAHSGRGTRPTWWTAVRHAQHQGTELRVKVHYCTLWPERHRQQHTAEV